MTRHALAALAVLALAADARAEPPASPAFAGGTPTDATLDAFVARWPGLAMSFVARHAALYDRPAACDEPAPVVSSESHASVSPDGKTLVAMVTLPDALTARLLGAPPDPPGADRNGWGPYALVFDGPRGAIWAARLDAFSACNGNSVAFAWSADSARVALDTDTGHGDRIGIVDVRARAVRTTAFAGWSRFSPAVQHVAWVPWYSGRTGPEGDQPLGDQLYVDEHAAWGAGDPDTRVYGVTWTSDTRFEFCGRLPLHAARRYAAVVVGARTRVAPIRGACSDIDEIP